MIRLFIDDIRHPHPDVPCNCIVRDAHAALAIFKTGMVTYASFDHDLGLQSPDGTWLINHLEKMVATDQIPMFAWAVHSANPVGARRMAEVLSNMEKRWGNRE